MHNSPFRFRFQGSAPQPFPSLLNDPAMAQPFSTSLVDTPRYHLRSATEDSARHHTPLFPFIPTNGQSCQEFGVENPSPSLANADPPRYHLRSAAEVSSRHSTPTLEVATSSGTSHDESDVEDHSDNTLANETVTLSQLRKARAPRTATFGLLYPIYGIDPVIKLYPSDFAQRAAAGRLPNVSLSDLFSPPSDAPGDLEIHRSLIIIGTQRFMVYGYIQPGVDVNETIAHIKPSSIWRGEVVIFSVGRRVPFLSRPGTRKVLNKAVARFVSRVTEAYDEGIVPPMQISMNR